ncbi:hypothetical protein [Nocardioides coralli]|uniref:hypothetical protein n=1 Tax=Nocardioides coralli TaxID=2872154 RepID=UPI001CA3F45B|nr:hypothetical protein [Nocardioides coralli]QZY28752.1 hypothetical protein K6T13_15025 [Nocardioides coralli]
MRIDWLPFSASALVAGATALSVAALLTPATESSAEALRLASEQRDARWLLVAGMFFLASVALTLGMPAILTLLDARNPRLGLTAVAVFAVGCIGTAGYAMILAFYKALVNADALVAEVLDQLTRDWTFAIFLYGWIAAFYLGELLIAIALLRARTVPRWVPMLLLAHVATLPLSQLVPADVASFAVLLPTIAFAGMGIEANSRHLVTAA